MANPNREKREGQLPVVPEKQKTGETGDQKNIAYGSRKIVVSGSLLRKRRLIALLMA